MEIIRRLRRKVPEKTFIADQEYVAQSLRRLPALLRYASERPDEYWENQQSTIWKRASAVQLHGGRMALRGAWAGIAATVALATMLLFSGSSPEPTKQLQNQADSDHELLLAVERAVQLEGPEALEPAALLAREINGSHQDHSANKGNQNHED
jgi:hypothetical protein